jgi:hypothetical protein
MYEFISAALFVICTSFVSHYLIKRKLAPWSGGVFLVMEDNLMVQVRFDSSHWDKQSIPSKSKIKEIFLAGARANMMPHVCVHTESSQCYYICESEHGAYIMYQTPIGNSGKNLYLDIDAPYWWRGCRHHPNDGEHYCGSAVISFKD